MSIVNLMANDDWSDADILNRTEAMVASEFPREEREALGRAVDGMALGRYTPQPEELARINRFEEVVMAARAAGIQARADMALLRQAFAVETATRRLALDPVLGDSQDEAERASAQSVIDAASVEALQLVAQRQLNSAQ